jgi:hypothetical protein
MPLRATPKPVEATRWPNTWLTAFTEIDQENRRRR